MQKTLIVIGVVFLVLGLAWPWLGSIQLGRLPGDIAIERENYSFYFPITTMIIISVLISAVLWLLNR